MFNLLFLLSRVTLVHWLTSEAHDINAKFADVQVGPAYSPRTEHTFPPPPSFGSRQHPSKAIIRSDKP